jgi:hypothetical protein
MDHGHAGISLMNAEIIAKTEEFQVHLIRIVAAETRRGHGAIYRKNRASESQLPPLRIR